MEEKRKRFSTGHYAGNKWGGKYLRAPDIFYTILEKGKGKLVRLGDIAKVRFGIKTGANEFFYLDEEAQEKWKIEKEFLKPVIKSPKECESIIVDSNKLKFKVFICNKSKSELKGTNALKYIEWGENQRTEKGFLWCKVPSVSGRKFWYTVDYFEGNTFWVKEIRERIAVFLSEKDIGCDCRLYFTKLDETPQIILNSTLVALLAEIQARNLGGGGGPRSMMVFEVNDQIIVNPNKITPKQFKQIKLTRKINSIFYECGIDPTKPIREQEPKPLPDREELDNIIFDELGLTKEERKEVYWAVCELVQQRLSKATSLKAK